MKDLQKSDLQLIGKNNSLTYKVRTNRFENNNCSFDLKTKTAYSYNWWRFFGYIGGKAVFNSYTYSSSTTRHQWKVRSILESLGIKIDIEIKSPKGLQDLTGAVEHYKYLINELEVLIKKPRTQKKKNEQRKNEIKELKKKLKQTQSLLDHKNKAV